MTISLEDLSGLQAVEAAADMIWQKVFDRQNTVSKKLNNFIREFWAILF